MSERRPSPEFFSALLCTVTWGALAFAAAGVMSWGLGREPVAQPVGPGFAYGALILAGGLVWLVSAFTARAALPWLGMLGAAAGSYLAVCAGAFVIGGLGLLVEQASSPFVLVAVLLAPGAVVLCWALARYTPHSRG